MKNWLLPTLMPVAMLLPSCVQSEHLPADATLVVLATLVSGGHNCDKFCSYRARVIRTLSGSPNISPGTVIDIEAYSFGPKIPKGACTFYLHPYSGKPSGLWGYRIRRRPAA